MKNNLLFLFAATILFVSFPLKSWSQDDSNPHNIIELLAIQKITNAIADRGYAHPGFDVVYEIYLMQKASGITFAEGEIISATALILTAKGRTLQVQDQCFTCDMRVLTPRGYRKIGDIREGESILSWDFKNSRLIENTVTAIDEGRSPAGTLHTTVALTGELKMTDNHPLYSPETMDYRPLSQMRETTTLQGVVTAGLSCRLLFGNRGPYIPGSRQEVRNLVLRDIPRNYIVEGVLVHSKPAF